MPNAAARAAEALLAYRRGDGPADLRARDLCRRLYEAMQAGAPAGPHTATSPAFLTLALDLLARRDPEVRVVVDALAAAVGPPSGHAAPPSAQVVHVTGDGNTVNVAGGDLRVTWPPERRSSMGTEPLPMPKLTVLFAAASPTNLARLRTEQEMREVREALELSPGRERFTLELRPALRARDFARALLQLRPRVVHFSGHGTAEAGEICFEDDVGCSQAANAEGLRGLFSGLGSTVECVVLNACYAHGNSTAISQAVPHVIGFDTDVSDEAAIAFAIGFYQGLGEGMQIREAHAWGAALMRLTGVSDAPPALLERGG
jgi:hypothetical protein